VSEPQYPTTGGPAQVTPPAPPPVSPPAAPPTVQSGRGQPQPAQSGWVMPASVAQGPGRVSGLVIVAALFLLVIGVLTALAGAILMIGGNMIGGNVLGQVGTADTGNGVFGALGGFIAGVAVVVIVWALLEIFGAFGMLLRRGWGRPSASSSASSARSSPGSPSWHRSLHSAAPTAAARPRAALPSSSSSSWATC